MCGSSHKFVRHERIADYLEGLEWLSSRGFRVRPDMPASRELLDICHMMTRTDKEGFVGMLERWHGKWEYFLNERSEDKNNIQA